MDELLEAGHRLRTFNPEPTPPVTAIYKRSDRRHRRRVLACGVSAVVLLAAAGGVVASILPSGQPQQVTTAGGGASLPPAAQDTASITVTLESGTAVAGTPIQGVVTVDNNSGRPISVPNPSCWGWPTVGLANSAIGFSPASAAVLCPTDTEIPVGVSRYPVTVATTYNACSQIPAQATSRFPACIGPNRNEMPPLPPGIYHTVTLMPSPFKVRNTVPVQLTKNRAP
jgi:hypothetical protein